MTVSQTSSDKFSIPSAPLADQPVGVGLRFKHMDEMLAEKQDIGWLEVHPENYFGGGKPRNDLDKARELYPISLHAVGLSLGSTENVSREHLKQIKILIDEIEPFAISDHASWSMSGNAHLNDLMPLPYTEESLRALCHNINISQDVLGRQMLVENPSTYIAYNNNDMSEAEFLNEAAKRTGCGLLLDVNNIYVQSHNHSFDPYHYISEINPQHVGEVHLAGHTERVYEEHDTSLLIDTHSKPVRDEVWALYEHTIKKLGVTNTLIEWDDDIPKLPVLIAEAHKARDIIRKSFPETMGVLDAAE